jgi:hypothetical protein
MTVHTKAEVFDEHCGQTREHEAGGCDATQVVDVRGGHSLGSQGFLDRLLREPQGPLAVFSQESLLIFMGHAIFIGFRDYQMASFNMRCGKH